MNSNPIPTLTPGEFQPRRKVLFASAHSVVDFSSGAAVATLDALQGLAADGFECRAFCTSRVDLPGNAGLENVIAGWGGPELAGSPDGGPGRGRAVHLRRDRVPVTIVLVESSPTVEEVRAVLEPFRASLDADPPDARAGPGQT